MYSEYLSPAPISKGAFSKEWDAFDTEVTA